MNKKLENSAEVSEDLSKKAKATPNKNKSSTTEIKPEIQVQNKKEKKVVSKTENKSNKKTKLIVIILAVCLLFAGAGIGLYFMLRETRVQPVVNAKVQTGTYYTGFTLETVPLLLEVGSTEGTIEWKDKSTVLVSGTHEYLYTFTPKDTDKYFTKNGSIEVTAVDAQIVSIAVKTAPTKSSGYTAFETFNAEGMVLEATFDSGEKQEFTSGFDVIYQTQDATTVLAGNTKVTISYAGKTCEVSIGTVAKLQIEEPMIVGEYVYNGESQTPSIAQSSRYSFADTKIENAGTYNIEVTLVDPANTMWKNHTADTKITLVWVINKADITVIENDYTAAFDAEEHSAVVEAENNAGIYYSLIELTSENYQTAGSIEAISRTQVSSTTVYYYVVGAQNYNDASGSLTLEIQKTYAKLQFEQNAYLTIENSSAVLDQNKVLVLGVNDATILHDSKVTLVYYTSYKSESENSKTTTANGATAEGLAPTAIGKYFVVAYYEGDDTYFASKSSAVSYVVEAENTDLVATEISQFDWRTSDESGYIDFIIDETTSPNSFTFTSNVYDPAPIMKVNGFYVFENDGVTYRIQLSADKNTLEITNTTTNEVNELQKWEAPTYIGTYTYVDPYAEDIEEETCYFTIYLEDGKMKYTFDYAYWNGSVVTGSVSGLINTDENGTYVDNGIQYIELNTGDVVSTAILTLETNTLELEQIDGVLKIQGYTFDGVEFTKMA